MEYNNIYSKARPVVQLDLEGNFISEYASIKEAELKTKFASSHIQDCCNDKKNYCKTYKGFQWMYKENYNPNKDYKISNPIPNRGRKVVQYDLNDNLINIYEKLSKVSDNKTYNANVAKCCNGILKTAYGYKWKYI